MPRSFLGSIFSFRCPSCREGKLFTNSNPYDLPKLTSMHDRCPNCGQNFQPEPGFFYGAMYVSYALTVAQFVAVVVLLNIFFDPGIWDIVITLTIVMFILSPPVFRLARSIWAHMFIKPKKKND